MDIKSWTKQVAVAKVQQALVNYGIKVEVNRDMSIYGDLIASWQRNQKQYLVFITSKITKAEVTKDPFKKTLEYCRDNNLKLLIIAWEYENKLFDYVMDLDETDSQLPFKIIEFSRLETLNSEWKELVIAKAN